jgi:hypothetical protein
MTPLETILSKSDAIEFDRRKVVGIQFTRSEIAKVSETPTRNPWKINTKLSAALPYNDYRTLIENLDYLDRRYPDYVSFSNIPNMDWVCRYTAPDYGTCTAALAQAMTVVSFSGNTLVLTNLPNISGAGAMSSTTPIFKAGDFIQIGSGTTNPYPFTSTSDVLRGTGSTITVTTNRPNFITASVTGSTITVGSNVTFKMFCQNMPTYNLVPGATKYANNKLVNNAYIQWSDMFKLYEWTGEA